MSIFSGLSNAFSGNQGQYPQQQPGMGMGQQPGMMAQQPGMMVQQPGMGMGQTSVFGTPYTTYKQGFLNVIARWNVADRSSTAQQKQAKIQQALQEVMNTPDLGNYGATQAFSSAASNYATYGKGLYNTARNRMGYSSGGKRRRQKKTRKARKMRGG
jgi:hypothetical protein